MAVGVLERAGVPAPERVVRRIGHDGSGPPRLLDKRIGLLSFSDDGDPELLRYLTELGLVPESDVEVYW